MSLQQLFPVLRQRLRKLAAIATDCELEPLPTTGLAHDHVRIIGTSWLLRIPKQSQLGLDAVANLHYQAACFERAAASDHTPRLHAVLEPSNDLPMGALVVDEIIGPVIRLPDELPLLVDALVAIHSVPLPEPGHRPPLKDAIDPLADALAEVYQQAQHLSAAGIHIDALRQIQDELAATEQLLNRSQRPPPTLISFDAHPGNFLVNNASQAILVDLEKARYGAPGYDLAHATLYTSTTWDVATYAVLDTAQIAAAYEQWLTRMPPELAAASHSWLLPLRRIMWLWSVTWCAKWRVQSIRTAKSDKHQIASTEDWSAELTEADLIRHVADRVDDYLNPVTIARVRDDWLGDNPLTQLLGR